MRQNYAEIMARMMVVMMNIDIIPCSVGQVRMVKAAFVRTGDVEAGMARDENNMN